MEKTPFWNQPRHPTAEDIAQRFDATIRRLVRLTEQAPEGDARVVNLRQAAGTLGHMVLSTQGAGLLVQQEGSHSAALALQSLAQHPASDSLMISVINFPNWGELRPTKDLAQSEP